MAQMLGNSRTWRWALCGCQHCKGSRNKAWKRISKRSARYREERLWRREASQ